MLEWGELTSQIVTLLLLNSYAVILRQEADEDDVDIEGEEEEEYEEYTWGDQTRIRATSLLEGGLAGKLKLFLAIYACIDTPNSESSILSCRFG